MIMPTTRTIRHQRIQLVLSPKKGTMAHFLENFSLRVRLKMRVKFLILWLRSITMLTTACFRSMVHQRLRYCNLSMNTVIIKITELTSVSIITIQCCNSVSEPRVNSMFRKFWLKPSKWGLQIKSIEIGLQQTGQSRVVSRPIWLRKNWLHICAKLWWRRIQLMIQLLVMK